MGGEAQPFYVGRRAGDGQIVLEVGGECDASTLGELNEALRELVEERPQELVVDLAHMTFIDSLTGRADGGCETGACARRFVRRCPGARAGGAARVRDHRLGQVPPHGRGVMC